MARVSEIYRSIQGETTYAGLPCTFVRLTGCPLRCSWCDSAYAFEGGETMSVGEIIDRVRGLGIDLVTVTGGEPAVQEDCRPLIAALADAGARVLLETSGAVSVEDIDPRSTIILDLKCPASGECDRNLFANLAILPDSAEIKFVIATREDYAWAKNTLLEYRLAERHEILFSWAFPPSQADALKPRPSGFHAMSLSELADAVIRDGLRARIIPQLHKTIWPSESRAR